MSKKKRKSKRLAACHGEETTPEDEDCFISPCGRLGSQYSIACGGKYLDTVSDFNDAIHKVNDWQRKNKVFPNIWMVSDHGNAVLINAKGNEISGNKKNFICDNCGSTKSVHVPANRDDVAGRECYDCGRGFIPDEPKRKGKRK